MFFLAGVRGYLKMLAVVIAQFKSLDKNNNIIPIVSGGEKVLSIQAYLYFILLNVLCGLILQAIVEH